VEKVQLIATRDFAVSSRFRYNGILGINPMDERDETKLDENAVINRMRKKNEGFTNVLPKLIITTQFDYELKADLKGIHFEILKLKLEGTTFWERFKIKIDLDSSKFMLPSRIYERFKRESKNVRTKFEYSFAGGMHAQNVYDVNECSFGFVDGSEMTLPLSSSGVLELDYVFGHHENNWISLGIFFLERFAVSFDLPKGKIYFQPKKGNV
jgi:hypothetical protein